jgi:hypothetical protein
MKAPTILSSPHFYQSPDFLREKFEGISVPNADDHETRFYVEPTTGITVKHNRRVQVLYAFLIEIQVDQFIRNF